MQPTTLCPVRHYADINWLFQIADYMPHHLPVSGGVQEQPAMIMDAAELISMTQTEWRRDHHVEA